MSQEFNPSPCPFCGGTDVRVHSYRGIEPESFMQCHNCSTTGPSALRQSEAVEKWNTRAALAQPACEVVPLTKDQIDFILGDSFLAANGSVYSTRVYDFVAAIECKFCEKNGIGTKGGEHGKD